MTPNPIVELPGWRITATPDDRFIIAQHRHLSTRYSSLLLGTTNLATYTLDQITEQMPPAPALYLHGFLRALGRQGLLSGVITAVIHLLLTVVFGEVNIAMTIGGAVGIAAGMSIAGNREYAAERVYHLLLDHPGARQLHTNDYQI